MPPSVQLTGNSGYRLYYYRAEQEFELYRAQEMKQLESDFDRAVKKLTDK